VTAAAMLHFIISSNVMCITYDVYKVILISKTNLVAMSVTVRGSVLVFQKMTVTAILNFEKWRISTLDK